MSGTNDDYRTGSADSENSSDSFVQVNKDDAPQLMDIEPPSTEPETSIPAVDDSEDIYGAKEEEEITAPPTDKEVQFGVLYASLWI